MFQILVNVELQISGAFLIALAEIFLYVPFFFLSRFEISYETSDSCIAEKLKLFVPTAFLIANTL